MQIDWPRAAARSAPPCGGTEVASDLQRKQRSPQLKTPKKSESSQARLCANLRALFLFVAQKRSMLQHGLRGCSILGVYDKVSNLPSIVNARRVGPSDGIISADHS